MYASTTLFNRSIHLNTTALSAPFVQDHMNNNNNLNGNGDDIMPRNRRQEEEAARAREFDGQKRGERNVGVPRGPDQNDSRLPVLEALQDLLTNGANVT